MKQESDGRERNIGSHSACFRYLSRALRNKIKFCDPCRSPHIPRCFLVADNIFIATRSSVYYATFALASAVFTASEPVWADMNNTWHSEAARRGQWVSEAVVNIKLRIRARVNRCRLPGGLWVRIRDPAHETCSENFHQKLCAIEAAQGGGNEGGKILVLGFNRIEIYNSSHGCLFFS